MPRDIHPDSDDLFAETRMSFGDHIEELRTHLWRAIVGFLLAMFVSFFFSGYVLEYIKKPIEKELKAFNLRRQKAYRDKIQAELREGKDPTLDRSNEPIEFEYWYRPIDLAKDLGQPAPKPPDGVDPADWWIPLRLRIKPLDQAILTADAREKLDPTPGVVSTQVTEVFMVYIKVSLLCGVVLGSPWIFYQIWLFVSAGLYSKEKKLVHVYLPFSLVLFLGGTVLCELVVIPSAVHVLLEFNEWLGVGAMMTLDEWLGFALIMPVVFGVSFQTPLLMLILAKIGIFDATTFRKKRRIAWFILAVGAAIIMPTGDVWSILMMQIPLIALYEFGILLAAYGGRMPSEEATDPEEVVGV